MESIKSVLAEAEKALYFTKSVTDLLINADFERDALSIVNLLETVGEMAESAREKITDSMIRMETRKTEV